MPSTIVNTTQTMRVNNATVNLRGSALMNDGVIDFTGVNARYDFTAVGPMTYSGSGVFGTTVTPFGGVGVSSNSLSPITLNAPIVTNRINLFTGGFVNSNQITLGNGGASTTVVQIGSIGLTTPGGSFDVSPVHNQGTGGQILLYAPRHAADNGRRGQPDAPADQHQPRRQHQRVTIAGGDLTLNSTAAALVLTNGRLITGANTLSLDSGTATVTRTNGFVDGNFRKTRGSCQQDLRGRNGERLLASPVQRHRRDIPGNGHCQGDPGRTPQLHRPHTRAAAVLESDRRRRDGRPDVQLSDRRHSWDGEREQLRDLQVRRVVLAAGRDGEPRHQPGDDHRCDGVLGLDGGGAWSDRAATSSASSSAATSASTSASATAATTASTASATTPTATSATTTAGLRRRSHDSGRSRGG